MECSFCRKLQKDGFRKVKCEGIDNLDQNTPCPTGEVYRLCPENIKFWFLWRRIQNIIFDGFGGINPGAISLVFDTYQVAQAERPLLLDKVLAIVGVIHEIRDSEKKHKEK